MNICMLSNMVKKEKRMPLIPHDIIELKNILVYGYKLHTRKLHHFITSILLSISNHFLYWLLCFSFIVVNTPILLKPIYNL